ncbi:MAG: LysM peptidoglycan-binding domain-containing protein [Anaerolineae bacterium]|nr:LysM peptidoglycan-binding domain-containing protein [Anaerolineae bacterium]
MSGNRARQLWLAAAAVLIGLLAGGGQPASAQSGELLTNPSFEPPFNEFVVPGTGQGFVASGWTPWWVNTDTDNLDTPEYKAATLQVDAYRVHDGTTAQQYFRKWAMHLAGVYQKVNGVTPGTRLRLTAWGMAWSTFTEPPTDPHNSAAGIGSNYIYMQIGIDPKGGTNPLSSDVVWSEVKVPMDFYDLFVLEVTAQGSSVTVYTRSTPQYAAPTIDVYWDDASLIAITPGSAPPLPGARSTGTPVPGMATLAAASTSAAAQPASTQSAAAQPAAAAPSYNPSTDQANRANNDTTGLVPVPAQSPDADGSQWHVVRYGEPLLRIAVTYGVTAPSIRELNSLRSDMLYEGQRLLISSASPPPTEIPATTVAEAAASTTAPSVTGTGQICLVLFEDLDGDGMWQQGEALLPGGALSISGASTGTHLTDGISEPFCFNDLPAGDYVVFAEPPDTHSATSLSEIPVTLADGSQVALSFGASTPDALRPGVATLDEAATDAEGRHIAGIPSGVVIAIGGGLLLLGLVSLGAAGYVFFFRKEDTASQPATDDLRANESSIRPDDTQGPTPDSVDTDGWQSPKHHS